MSTESPKPIGEFIRTGTQLERVPPSLATGCGLAAGSLCLDTSLSACVLYIWISERARARI